MDQPFQSQQNRLLASLPPDELQLLRPRLTLVTLDYRLPLYEAHKPIAFVYFPISGVASLVTTLIDGSASEVGTVGNEGLVGMPIILGDAQAPTGIYVQVPGSGLRLPARVLTTTMARSEAVRTVMLHYVHAFFNQIAQSAACNGFHSVLQRTCRWLLMTHDRVQSDRFMLTQEFLGMMLGVRRTSVTLAAQKLKEQKLIEYHRGQVAILDRAGLERCSCECYEASRREFDRLLGRPDGVAVPEA
jgi:CRP-like cAMP-binding protein